MFNGLNIRKVTVLGLVVLFFCLIASSSSLRDTTSPFFAFIGKLHFFNIHIPIGVIFFLVVFEIAFYKKRNELSDVRNTLLFILALTTVLVACMGLSLSFLGYYKLPLATGHQHSATTLVVLSCVTYLFFSKKRVINFKIYYPIIFVQFILVIVTGIMGSTMAHGAITSMNNLEMTYQSMLTLKF